jgi:protein-disulfide isomerase
MRCFFRFAALLALVCLALPAQTDWNAATDLPNVDFTGLTSTQKEEALRILRGESCTCGCNMKLAQCRMVDPPCGDSRALASIVVEGVRNHRTADQIHEALVTSAIAKMRANQNRILGDPMDIDTAGAPERGPQSAKIAIVEFSDFECPYCVKAVSEIASIMAAYPRDVKLIFKQFPLDDLHPHAMMAAEASLSANDQGKFWQMHDELYAHAGRLSRETIFAIAQSIGLDMMRFTRDIESGRFHKAVEADVAEGDKLGVFGTPSLFINGKPYHGPVILSILKPILDNELKPKTAVTASAR